MREAASVRPPVRPSLGERNILRRRLNTRKHSRPHDSPPARGPAAPTFWVASGRAALLARRSSRRSSRERRAPDAGPRPRGCGQSPSEPRPASTPPTRSASRAAAGRALRGHRGPQGAPGSAAGTVRLHFSRKPAGAPGARAPLLRAEGPAPPPPGPPGRDPGSSGVPRGVSERRGEGSRVRGPRTGPRPARPRPQLTLPAVEKTP